jgi:uridine kinase
MPEKKHLYGASVIIVEGIMTLMSPEMRDLFDLKVFVVSVPALSLQPLTSSAA